MSEFKLNNDRPRADGFKQKLYVRLDKSGSGRSRTSFRSFSVVCFILGAITLSAKSAGRVGGEGHIGDMAVVLGVDSANKQMVEAATPLLREITGALDADAQVPLKKIKLLDPQFSWGPYTHRLFFHWGYGVEPETSAALSNRLAFLTGDSGHRQEIYGVLSRHHLERMSKIRAATEKLCGLSPERTEALAALLYDVHLLGDYAVGSSKSEPALLPFDLIADDILKAMWILGQGSEYESPAFTARIQGILDSSGDNKGKAVRFLDFLKVEIPKMLLSQKDLD